MQKWCLSIQSLICNSIFITQKKIIVAESGSNLLRSSWRKFYESLYLLQKNGILFIGISGENFLKHSFSQETTVNFSVLDSWFSPNHQEYNRAKAATTTFATEMSYLAKVICARRIERCESNIVKWKSRRKYINMDSVYKQNEYW